MSRDRSQRSAVLGGGGGGGGDTRGLGGSNAQ